MTKRILVVDDEPSVTDGMARLLRKDGYAVEAAANGFEALRRFRAAPPDLVITDVLMPMKEGVSLVIELRQIDPDIPIIVISGGGRARFMEFLDIAARAGATATFQKPVPVGELRRAIRDCFQAAPPRPAPVGERI